MRSCSTFSHSPVPSGFPSRRFQISMAFSAFVGIYLSSEKREPVTTRTDPHHQQPARFPTLFSRLGTECAPVWFVATSALECRTPATRRITVLRNMGLGELLVILVIVMVLFGAKRLPDL